MKHKFIILILSFYFISTFSYSQDRDSWQQPQKVMDVIGVKKGMTIGEPGAGNGYFTFKLSKRVGRKGKIYANDINNDVLEEIKTRCGNEGIKNIETILGEVEDPLFPIATMDMIVMVYVIHDMDKPVEFLKNLRPSMKKEAKLILLEQEPNKTGSDHFWSQEKILKTAKEAGFKLHKIETFLIKDTIYIFKK